METRKINLVKAKRRGGGRETTQIDEMTMYYLNGLGLPTGPRVMLNFAKKEVTAVADGGARVGWKPARMYENVKMAGLSTSELPIEGAILVTALGTRSRRITK
jgi:hypothetical protein